MSDLVFLQGTWLGTQGVGVAEPPGPGGNRTVPRGRRFMPPVPEYDLSLKELGSLKERRPASTGGRIRLSALRAVGGGRVVYRRMASGQASLTRVQATGGARVISRAGARVSMALRVSGAAVVDTRDEGLADLLGLRDCEDFR